MDGLVQFTTDGGAQVVLADVGDDGSGARLVSRGDGPALAARTFEASLGPVRTAAESALRVFRDGELSPDSVEIEFGVRMTAEAGALLLREEDERPGLIHSQGLRSPKGERGRAFVLEEARPGGHSPLRSRILIAPLECRLR